MDISTINFIHQAAWAVLVFVLGMIVGYLLKVVVLKINNKYD